jgi:probable HAF family extracellular repeat protein
MGNYFGILRAKTESRELVILMYLSVPEFVLPPLPPGIASFNGLGDEDALGLQADVAGVSSDGAMLVGRGRAPHSSIILGLRWADGAPANTILEDLPGGGVFSVAYGASNAAAVLVGQGFSANGLEALMVDATGTHGLGDLFGGDFRSAALAVSADGGTVVGYGTNAAGISAMRWRSGEGIVDLGNIPGGTLGSCALGVSANGAVIVGYASSQGGKCAARWLTGGPELLPYLPGGFSSEARAVSADGAVVTGQSDSSDGPQAFRWTAGSGTQGLGDLAGGAFYSCANAVNHAGDLIVGTSATEQGFEAFIWSPESGMVRLHDVLAAAYGLDPAGWRLTSAVACSSDGRVIVGRGVNPSGKSESWVVKLP